MKLEPKILRHLSLKADVAAQDLIALRRERAAQLCQLDALVAPDTPLDPVMFALWEKWARRRRMALRAAVEQLEADIARQGQVAKRVRRRSIAAKRMTERHVQDEQRAARRKQSLVQLRGRRSDQ